MTKMKIIRNKNSEVFERDINDFVRQKEVIDIKYQIVMLPIAMNEKGFNTEYCVCDSALIIYKE